MDANNTYYVINTKYEEVVAGPVTRYAARKEADGIEDYKVVKTPANLTELVEAVKHHAQTNYEAGGWDVIVECYDDQMIAKEIMGAQAKDAKAAIEAFRTVVSVMAEREADAIISSGEGEWNPDPEVDTTKKDDEPPAPPVAEDLKLPKIEENDLQVLAWREAKITWKTIATRLGWGWSGANMDGGRGRRAWLRAKRYRDALAEAGRSLELPGQGDITLSVMDELAAVAA